MNPSSSEGLPAFAFNLVLFSPWLTVRKAMCMAQQSDSVKVVIVPGLYNSGPDHWQSIWGREHSEFLRVEQRDWETPACEDWVAALDVSVKEAGTSVVLVGHSLGTVTIAHWAMKSSQANRVKAAMLVAPSDVEAPGFPSGPQGFAPIPLLRLPFPSLVVASSNDRYIAPSRAKSIASAWGSEFIEIGLCGHISTIDGFGQWPEGKELLHKLLL